MCLCGFSMLLTCCIRLLCHSECVGFFFDFQFFPLTLYFFFLLLNLTCILSFCGVIYLAVDFLCYLDEVTMHNVAKLTQITVYLLNIGNTQK